MPSLLNFTNPTFANSPQRIDFGTVSRREGSFVYCNYPERVTSNDKADTNSRKYLNSSNVSGKCHVYSWHENKTGNSAYHALHISNRGSSTITVKVTNYGLTNNVYNDLQGWKNYFGTKYNNTYVLDQGTSINLFQQYVANNAPCGYVGFIDIIGGSARLQDVFYSSSPNDPIYQATSNDPLDDLRRRGMDPNGHIFNLTTPTITVTNSQISEMIVFGSDDNNSFGNDEKASMSGKSLVGCFGQIMNIKMLIKNGSTTSKKAKICIASRGGASRFLVGLTTDPTFTNTHSVITSGLVDAKTFVDIIETDSIPAGATREVSFFTVVPADSFGPTALSARF